MGNLANLNGKKQRVASCLRSSSSSDCWYTPRWVLDELGTFDLDPANSEPQRFPTAKRHYGPEIDGLSQPWKGRIWLNPPFSNASVWVDRMVEHGNGICLVFCRSDAAWFHRATLAADAFLMLKGRVQFTRPDGSGSRCPLGCVLLAFGKRNAAILRRAKLPGVFLEHSAGGLPMRAAA